jgi:hypothetical protein
MEKVVHNNYYDNIRRQHAGKTTVGAKARKKLETNTTGSIKG